MPKLKSDRKWRRTSKRMVPLESIVGAIGQSLSGQSVSVSGFLLMAVLKLSR